MLATHLLPEVLGLHLLTPVSLELPDVLDLGLDAALPLGLGAALAECVVQVFVRVREVQGLLGFPAEPELFEALVVLLDRVPPRFRLSLGDDLLALELQILPVVELVAFRIALQVLQRKAVVSWPVG